MRRTGFASLNSCPPMIPEARVLATDIIGYLVGHANLTNTRSLALLADPDASAYELLFSFSSPEEKNEFLNLVRSNEDMGKDYIIELTSPTPEEIRNARPLATVLPQDALTHVMLIAATLGAGTEDDRASTETLAKRNSSCRAQDEISDNFGVC